MRPANRPRRLTTFALVAGLVAALVGTPAVSVGGRDETAVDMSSFMAGLACTESTGRYTAVNERSGAYGKYQIMPRNWRAWAGRYLGNRWSKPTPRNQEFVARQRIQDLYDLRGSWRRVAFWWLTGNGEPDESKWTAHSLRYVERVMGAVRHATAPGARATAALPDQCFPGYYPDPSVREEPWPRVRIIGGRVYIRSAAGSENRPIRTVIRGKKLAVLGRANDARGKPWLKVGLRHGDIGWIAKWYTERIERPRSDAEPSD